MEDRQHIQTAPTVQATAVSPGGGSMSMARFAGLDAERRPLVWVAGAAGAAPVTARCLATLSIDAPVGTPVLLVAGLPGEFPVIVGMVSDRAPEPVPGAPLLDTQLGRPDSASADGRRLVFEAEQEIVLKCGRGSITLQANGRVVIKGTELVSRALGSNKIRGATVNIN